MALQKQNIEVSLLPMNQQVPASMGPIGRVDSVRNGMVKKFLAGGSGPRMRIEKRPGMTSLPTDAFANGTAIDSPANPKILASWKDQLFLLGGSTPYVFSETNDAWERPSNIYTTAPQVAPYKISRAPLYSASSRAYAPDVASVGDVFCRAVADSTYGPQIIFVDKEGVQIRAPLTAAGTPTKVVSDGTVFWVYSQGATSTEIRVYDTSGVLLASSSIAWGVSRPGWDCGFQSQTGTTFLVTPTGATLTVTYSTYAAGVITSTTYTPAADVPNGVGRMENDIGGNNIYVVGTNVAGDIIGYEITAAGVISTTYPVASAVISASHEVGNITGFVSNGSFDLVVAVGLVSRGIAGLDGLNNKTLIYAATHAGTSALSVTQRSIAPVSRAFADPDGIYRIWAYYLSTACFSHSGSTRDISELDAQPSFFSMNISASVPMVDGQIEVGSAYAFYSATDESDLFTPFALSSIAIDSDGVQHVPLGTLGVQVPFFSTTTGFTAVTVISDYLMSPWPGETLVTSDSLVLPGFQSMSFDGSVVTESCLQLAPEITTVAGAVMGGFLNPDETYNYVAVWRTTDTAGNVIRSPLSAVETIGQTGGTATKYTLTIATLRTTARLNVICEIYRTFDPTGGASEGTELRLVGTVANTILADTVTFADTLSDTDAAIGTSCYSQVLEDNPELDHFAPPAHSSGINFQDRSMVIGFDGAIWISSSRIEGEIPWYNPLLRIVLPSGARPIRLVPMDTRVIVMCAGGELWGFQGNNLPNATLTSGALPTPEQIPFTTGASGPAAMTPMGAVYAAPRGVWLMDRAITQAFIGAGVLDEVDSTSAPTGIVTNDDQRLYFLMSEDGNPSGGTGDGGLDTILVYDFITGSWWIWELPRVPAFATSWKGRFTWVDFDACKVWREDLPETSTYTDDGDAIITRIALSSMSFDGASGFQRLWGEEIFGEWKGPHILAAAFTYDNGPAVGETLTMPAGVDPDEYRYEIRQEKQKNIAVEIEFSDSFSWATLATIVSSTATTMIVDDLSNLRVGSSYSTRTGGVLDTGSFEVLALSPTSKRVTFSASGGWIPVATHEVIHETDSLDPGNSFSLESVELRIGVKGGLGRLPTQRRMGA